LLTSCGVDGDPGHCYFSIDWEWYNDDYGVYYYEDDNPDVPESSEIEAQLYYDCYPGVYDYYYEAEDPKNWYTYEGYYTLYQNPGFRGGLLRDGPDGVDTYFDLYLLVYPEVEDLRISESDQMAPTYKKSIARPLFASRENFIQDDPIHSEEYYFKNTRNDWTIEFSGVRKVYRK